MNRSQGGGQPRWEEFLTNLSYTAFPNILNTAQKQQAFRNPSHLWEEKRSGGRVVSAVASLRVYRSLCRWATHAGLTQLPLAPQKPSALTEAPSKGTHGSDRQGCVWDAKQTGGLQAETGRDLRGRALQHRGWSRRD